MGIKDDTMNLLQAIREHEPCERMPDVPGFDRAAVNRLMGYAYRSGWISVSSYVGDGTFSKVAPLRLTSEGHAALLAATNEQDSGASEPTGTSIDAKRANRTAIMNALYDRTGGGTGIIVTTSSLARDAGLSGEVTQATVRHLSEKQLLRYAALGGKVAITPKGVDEVEQARAPDNLGTENLNQIFVQTGDISGAVVQIGSHAGGDVSAAPVTLSAPEPKADGWWSSLGKMVKAIVIGASAILLATLIGFLWHLIFGSGAKPSGGLGSSGPTSTTYSSTVSETADNHRGSPVFSDPSGRAVSGAPSRIPYGTQVKVRCEVPNSSGTFSSATAFYLIASGEWEGDYVVADTMTNGGPLGNTSSPNVDPRVGACH